MNKKLVKNKQKSLNNYKKKKKNKFLNYNCNKN